MQPNLNTTKLKDILAQRVLLTTSKLRLYKFLLEKEMDNITYDEIKMINLLGRDKSVQNYLKNI